MTESAKSRDDDRAGDRRPIDLEPFINSVVDYAIVRLDVGGKVSSWNLGAERVNGYAASEIVGRDFSIFYTADDRVHGLPRVLLQQAKDAGHVEHTGWRVRKDGGKFWGDVVITAVRDRDRELLGFIKVTRDLTERMLAEQRERQLRVELENVNQMKAQFLANMSHELRTPLNGIMGMLGLLTGSGLLPFQEEMVHTAHSSSEAMVRIVDDILDFSKIEADRVEIEAQPFGVSDLLEEVCGLFEPEVRSKSLSLECVNDDVMDVVAVGDRVRLRQILANLVGNAVKFTQQGSITVAARVVGRTETSITISFDVTDTGVGIGGEDASRLFEPFVQADASTTRRFGGTGLGLPISQRLVALMGGAMSVESALGEGSTFSFTIEFSADESGPGFLDLRQIAPKETGDASPVWGSTHERILIAEDNEVNQRVSQLQLETFGYEVTVVNNGKAAVDAVANEDFAVVLMDCRMPMLNGFDATRSIRAMAGSKGRTPIIAVTASALSRDRELCLDAGMDDFVVKPVYWQSLNETIRRLLSSRTVG